MKHTLESAMASALSQPLPDEGKDKTCPTCGHTMKWLKRNQNGVPGWNKCSLHKAAPELLDQLQKAVDWATANKQRAGTLDVAGMQALLSRIK